VVNYKNKINTSLGRNTKTSLNAAKAGSKPQAMLWYEDNHNVSKEEENYSGKEFLLEKLNVLYLDDDKDVLDSYNSMHRFDFNIFSTINADEAREIIEKNDIHIIIADQRMPKITGLNFFASIMDEHPEPIRILLTGYSDVSSIINAVDSDIIYRHMTKPFTPEEMKLMIKNAAEVYFLRKEKQRLLDDIALADEKLRFIYSKKKRI